MPQLLLQAVHSDQWLTRQSRRRFDAANEARRRVEPVAEPDAAPEPTRAVVPDPAEAAEAATFAG